MNKGPALRRFTYTVDRVNTQMRCSGCPAGKDQSKVVKEAQTSSKEGQEGRKGLEGNRKLDHRKGVKFSCRGGEKTGSLGDLMRGLLKS